MADDSHLPNIGFGDSISSSYREPFYLNITPRSPIPDSLPETSEIQSNTATISTFPSTFQIDESDNEEEIEDLESSIVEPIDNSLDRDFDDENSEINFIVTGSLNFGLTGSCDEKIEDPEVLIDELFEKAEKEKSDFIILTGNFFSSISPEISVQNIACRRMTSNLFKRNYSQSNLKCVQAPNKPNWVDENLNIKMPVLSLYGNIDRPIITSEFLTPGKQFHFKFISR